MLHCYATKTIFVDNVAAVSLADKYDVYISSPFQAFGRLIFHIDLKFSVCMCACVAFPPASCTPGFKIRLSCQCVRHRPTYRFHICDAR